MKWNSEITRHFPHGPKLALFDLDGTLVDSIPTLTLATDQMLTALGREAAGIAKVTLWVGNGVEMLIRRAVADGNEALALTLDEAALAPARTAFNQAYLATLGSAAARFAGVDEFLTQVTIPKVLITNKSRLFTEKLIVASNLAQHFVQVICGDDLAEKKPSPLPLLHASHSQGIAPADCLMFGDSRNDVQAAKAAGMAVVAVTYGYNHGEDIHAAGANWVVENLLSCLN